MLLWRKGISGAGIGLPTTDGKILENLNGPVYCDQVVRRGDRFLEIAVNLLASTSTVKSIFGLLVSFGSTIRGLMIFQSFFYVK